MADALIAKLRLIPKTVSTAGKGGVHCEVGLWCHEAADHIAALQAERDTFKAALDKARAEIDVADVVGQKNAAGYVTDRALWAERAINTIDEALKGATT